MKKKAILVVSFGVLDQEAERASIGRLINKAKDEFQTYDIWSAFTSSFIIRRLRERMFFVYNLHETLDKLKSLGYDEIIVQPTHLAAGEEYEKKIVAVCDTYRESFAAFALGKPLLMCESRPGVLDDFTPVIDCLRMQSDGLREDEEAVFMGHGFLKRRSFVYEKLQERLDQVGDRITIGVLESCDSPNFQEVLARINRKRVKRVRLMPLLFVGGMHVSRDMSGDHPLSWKNQLLKAGIEVTADTRGLGEYALFREIYLRRIADMIAKKDGMDI